MITNLDQDQKKIRNKEILMKEDVLFMMVEN